MYLSNSNICNHLWLITNINLWLEKSIKMISSSTFHLIKLPRTKGNQSVSRLPNLCWSTSNCSVKEKKEIKKREFSRGYYYFFFRDSWWSVQLASALMSLNWLGKDNARKRAIFSCYRCMEQSTKWLAALSRTKLLNPLKITVRPVAVTSYFIVQIKFD